MKSRTLLTAVLALAVAAGVVFWKWGNELEFVLGGAMVNVGYRLQDPFEDFNLAHKELDAEEVWQEFLRQNDLAASVRDIWPRTSRHPLVALVLCMDARLDTNEIAGDTRHYYYIVRTAGSVLAEKEEEMLELAVANGTKVIVFTTHTDCAAEKMAADPDQRPLYPSLTAALEEREMRWAEFRERPAIRSRLDVGELVVKHAKLHTDSARVTTEAASATDE